MVVGLFLLLGIPGLASAQSLAPSEKQKIEALINRVKSLKDAKFVRNGSGYSSDNAARFLKGKWDANAADVKSAKDFIDKVASFSGTSGKPYLIRFKDGKEVKSQEYLLAELKRIESAGP
ncbi:MAG: hypothetical protein FJ145_25705 [Deltaproteobacteria bacterium]|nr:hypothetical protein [Deltaproteobacteria bacterium]